MRITKHWLRNAKTHLLNKTSHYFELSEVQLLEEVERRLGCRVTDGTHVKLLKQLILWAIEDSIPW